MNRTRAPIYRLSRLRNAWSLVRTQWLAAKGRHHDVIRLLERLYSKDNGFQPRDLNLWGAMRYAASSQRLGRFKNSFSALQVAIDELDDYRRASASVRSKEERDYLYFYCKWIGSLHPQGSPGSLLALSIGGAYGDLVEGRVRPFLRRSFPITRDGGLAVDGFIESNLPPLEKPPT